MVDVEPPTHVRVPRNFETRISLALAESVGIFKLHDRSRRLQLAHVPAGVEHEVLQRTCRAHGTFHETNAARSGAAHQVRRTTQQLGMDEMRPRGGQPTEAIARSTRHVDLDGNGFVAHQLFDAAELVKHSGELGGEVIVIGSALGNSHGRGGRHRGMGRFGKRGGANKSDPFSTSHDYGSSLIVAQISTLSMSTPEPSSVG